MKKGFQVSLPEHKCVVLAKVTGIRAASPHAPTKNLHHRIVEAIERGSVWHCSVNWRMLKICSL